MRAAKIGRLVPSGHYSQCKCGECGKLFTLPCAVDAYPMRIDTIFFCKFTCKLKYERTHKIRPNIARDYMR